MYVHGPLSWGTMSSAGLCRWFTLGSVFPVTETAFVGSFTALPTLDAGASFFFTNS